MNMKQGNTVIVMTQETIIALMNQIFKDHQMGRKANAENGRGKN